MKRTTIWSTVLLGALFIAPAWSHHPAEGIISDDVWQRINDHLIAIESPHLLIDFSDAMTSMRVREDSNQGCQLLVTSITVYEEDVHDYAAHMEFTLEELMQEMGGSGQDDPGGSNTRTCNSPGYDVVNVGGGLAEMTLYEPIVAEMDQPDTPPATPPGTPPETPPGKGGK